MKRDRNTFFEENSMNMMGYNQQMMNPGMYQGMNPAPLGPMNNNYFPNPNPMPNIPTNTYPSEYGNNLESRLAKMERQITRLENRITKIENTTITGNYANNEEIEINNSSMYVI